MSRYVNPRVLLFIAVVAVVVVPLLVAPLPGCGGYPLLAPGLY